MELQDEVTTTHSAAPASDKTNVVVHYHINNHRHLHEHMVYYAENSWLKTKEDKCPYTAGLPAVVPGAKPAADNSTNAFMNFVHPENHPAGS